MAKYLLLWDLDRSRIPVDLKERGAAWGNLMSVVKQDMEAGLMKDWGVFPGETGGYVVYEGSEVDVMISTSKLSPFSSFTVHPVATVSQVEELFAAMASL